MNDKKHDKTSRGRHVAADSNTAAPASPAGSPKAVQPPSETAVLPQAVKPVKVNGGKPPRAHAGDQAFPAGSAMMPVDAAESTKRRRKHKPLKIIGITLGVLLALVLVAYAGIALYFNDRFMPNTTVGDLNVSLMTSEEAQKVLTSALDDYTLSISGNDFSFKLTSEEAGLAFDEVAIVQSMLDDVNPWLWPFELRKDHDESDKLVASNTGGKLNDAIRAAVESFNESAKQPTNATVLYNEKKDTFAVQPEVVGTALDPEAVVKAADEAASALNPRVKLTAEHLLQPTVRASDPQIVSAAEQANALIRANFVLTMAGDTAAEVNADLISQWVQLGEDLTVALNEEALTAWVDELVKNCNTVGTERTYTRPDGKEVTVSGGIYGWAVNEDELLKLVKDGVAAGTKDTVEVPCSTTGTAYNGPGKQDWGPRYCDIDLSEQHARFYDESGALVWESAIVSGTPNGSHNTPTGVYWLNQKASPSVLRGTNLDGSKYESKVQYWMPFVQNYIGLHDASWQSAFGGNRYRNGAGSHGCVNLPTSAAASLYGIIKGGDVVVCHW